jgi:rhamnosyltransferase
MKKVGVSIVIPTLNGGETFRECLAAIFSQKTDTSFEVIVMDSGSTDGTVEMLRGFDVRLVEVGPGEFNHGETRNRGIAMAGGEVVILMTQDAVPISDGWLDAMTRPFEEDPLVAGVYARQVPRDDADVLTRKHLESWLTGRPSRHVSYIEDRAEYERMRPMKRYFFCNFDDVCSAIRKDVWEKIPYERTDFAEDLEWSKKVLEAGFKIVYEPGAAVGTRTRALYCMNTGGRASATGGSTRYSACAQCPQWRGFCAMGSRPWRATWALSSRATIPRGKNSLSSFERPFLPF